MKKLIAAAGLGAALIAGPLLGAGTASADLLSDRGELVCSAMDHHPTLGGLTAYYHTTGVSLGDFAAALGYGVHHYCPQHSAFAQTWLENL